MKNELLLIVMVALEMALLFLLIKRMEKRNSGGAWIVAFVIFNLISVSFLGGKLVEVFGFTSNVGNVFYAFAFVGVSIVAELFGQKSAYNTSRLGLIFIIASVFALSLANLFVPLPQASDAASLLQHLSQYVPRLAFASMFAYIFAVGLNIWLYGFLKQKTKINLGLRHIITNTSAQALDSVIFFPVAFWAILPPAGLFEAAMIGFLIKTVIAILSTPFLYFARRVKAVGGGVT